MNARASEAIGRDVLVGDGERLADGGCQSLCSEERKVCERTRRKGHGFVSGTGVDKNNPNAQEVGKEEDKAWGWNAAVADYLYGVAEPIYFAERQASQIGGM